jgi:N6-L-threonylcarbamoyladenine synthase
LENLDLENILLEFLPKEPELAENLKEYIKNKPQKPTNIDYLAVTAGPGLEPALWTGINLARALSFIWQIPLIPVNHLAGHIISPLLKTKVENINWPTLALVASGGHTDLILVKNNWLCQTLGSTRDDAIGEAFDKTARLLDLPYPGGPELSKLAAQGRKLKDNLPQIDLPRPMLKSGDLDFSFSGLKTAVMYTLRDNQPLNQEFKMSLACEFEEAAIEVLIEKIKQAIEIYEIKTVIIGGGVTANVYLRDQLKLNLEQLDNNINLLLPEKDLATDNAAMIAATGSLLNEKIKVIIAPEIIARGRWPLGENPKKPF